MTITIKDVAARAGVSPKTVSRVINEEPHVRADVRERVMAVVRELDYRPNAFARGLSSSRSFLIGLFFENPTSAYAGDIQRGALSRCRELSHHLLVEPLDPAKPGWRGPLTAMLDEVRLGGTILTPPICDDPEVVALFEQARVPVVRIAPALPDGGTPQVRIDDRQAAYELTQRLIDVGHREIAFVRGHPDHSAAHHRWDGFRAALDHAGVAVREAFVIQGDFTFRSGLDAGAALLDGTPRPTAVFGSNDEMALGVMVAAMQRGITVPDDVSVVGFDDAEISRMAWPQITTVRQPNVEMAETAVDMLIGHRYGARRGEPGLCSTLPYELLWRDSSAAPPAARPT